MAITVIASGTQSASLETEHDLSTSTANHVFVLVVDTGAMVALDVVEFKIYTKVLSGGTERLAYLVTYSGAQIDPAKYSQPVPANISLRATLNQSAGSGRSFPWSLLALA